MVEQFAEGLDDGLQLPQQFVHHQSGFLPAMAHYHYVFPSSRLALDVEMLLQTNEGQHLAAQVDVVASQGVLQCIFGQLDTLDHHVQGDDVVSAANPHQEAVYDGQGQGQADPDQGALAGFAIQFDAATQRLNVAFDHIHADPAPGQLVTASAVEKPGSKMSW